MPCGPYHQSDSHRDFALRNCRRAVGDGIGLVEHGADTIREAAQAHSRRKLGTLAGQGTCGPNCDQADLARLETFGRKRTPDRARWFEFVGPLR
jgi:hypothetical protein